LLLAVERTLFFSMFRSLRQHRPPPAVAYVARTHWVVGAIIVLSIGVLHLFVRQIPHVESTRSAYLITLGLAGLYLGTGTLVWFGTPLGRFCSRLCGLLYLVRPQLGDRLWRIMRSPEYKAHFARPPSADPR
jgi:hypothetical protein